MNTDPVMEWFVRNLPKIIVGWIAFFGLLTVAGVIAGGIIFFHFLSKLW